MAETLRARWKPISEEYLQMLVESEARCGTSTFMTMENTGTLGKAELVDSNREVLVSSSGDLSYKRRSSLWEGGRENFITEPFHLFVTLQLVVAMGTRRLVSILGPQGLTGHSKWVVR